MEAQDGGQADRSTNKDWQKIKGSTAGKIGFGEKLGAYAAAKEKTEEMKTRSSASFEAAAAGLAETTDKIPKAQAKSNKTLQGDDQGPRRL